MIYAILHWIVGCYGHTDREIDRDGVEWIGMRCVQCNKFKLLSPSVVQSERGWDALERQGSPYAAMRVCSNDT